MKYKCLICENIGTKTFRNLSDSCRCKKCGNKRAADKQRYNYEQVESFFYKKNMKLLTKEYKNTSQQLKYRCLKCGYIGTKMLLHLLKGHGCPSCYIKSQFNPNITKDERERRRIVPRYRKWRTKIYKRDNYICKKCNNKKKFLNAHHKNAWNKFPEQRYDINNGITFCIDCHKKFHKLYGIGNNIEKQTQEFLNEGKISA